MENTVTNNNAASCLAWIKSSESASCLAWIKSSESASCLAWIKQGGNVAQRPSVSLCLENLEDSLS